MMLWTTLGAIGLLALLRASLLTATVRGESMLPALAPGDRILVLRRWAGRRPRRHDVVVCRAAVAGPGGVRRSELMVKRVGGVPGDRAVVARRTVVVGPRQVFVVGDNPGRSFDSRAFGPLPADHIVGTVIRHLRKGTDVPVA